MSKLKALDLPLNIFCDDVVVSDSGDENATIIEGLKQGAWKVFISQDSELACTECFTDFVNVVHNVGFAIIHPNSGINLTSLPKYKSVPDGWELLNVPDASGTIIQIRNDLEFADQNLHYTGDLGRKPYKVLSDRVVVAIADRFGNYKNRMRYHCGLMWWHGDISIYLYKKDNQVVGVAVDFCLDQSAYFDDDDE